MSDNLEGSKELEPTQQTAWAGSNLFLVEPTTRHALNRDKLSV